MVIHIEGFTNKILLTQNKNMKSYRNVNQLESQIAHSPSLPASALRAGLSPARKGGCGGPRSVCAGGHKPSSFPGVLLPKV